LEYALDDGCARSWILKRHQRLNFADHPEARSVEKETDPEGSLDKPHICFEPTRYGNARLLMLIELDQRGGTKVATA
jgi:hypothetical protein